jgi:acetate kinase
MTILVLNCGSSSVKYQVIQMTGAGKHDLLAKGLVERIGIDNSIITHRPTGKDKVETITSIPDHTVGIDLIIKAITDPVHGVVKSLDEIGAVGHRVAHGGEFFKESALINDTVMEQIGSCVDLAPLHNPANMKGIYAITKLMPKVPQVATFDTSFHQTMPGKAYIYAIPYKYYEQYRIRRYGFHGTSHKFVAQQGCAMTGLDFNNSKIVTCHIGNGGSVTAIHNGKSVDTSMGFTPVDGLIMGTRAGETDPGILNFLANKEGMSSEALWNMLNKESGVLGITGISSDMRDIESAQAAGNERAALALDAYFYRVKKYVGAYAAAMGGLDMVIFTGGVGENDAQMRKVVCSGMEFLGLEFDAERNKVRGKSAIISTENSRVKALVVETNEELVIATDTFNIVSK